VETEICIAQPRALAKIVTPFCDEVMRFEPLLLVILGTPEAIWVMVVVSQQMSDVVVSVVV
jgi:hypothetical protein